jgi:hypothetical protein
MQDNFGFGANPEQAQPVAPAFGHNTTANAGGAFGVGIAANRDDIYDANRRRLLFVCGFNQIEMTQAESGLTTPFLQTGKPIKTVAASMMVPTFEIDDENKPSAVLLDFSAKFFHDNIIQKTTRQPDYGVRSLAMLVGLNYEEKFENGQHVIFNDLADAYFDVLFPSVTTRGAKFMCPEGLSDCPTCALKWLTSPECEARYHQAVQNNADPTILQQLHKRLGESVQATIKHANTMWSGIIFDINQAKQNKPGKNTLSDTDNHIRKMLHQVAPEMQQTNAIIEGSRETGRVIAEATGAAIREVLNVTGANNFNRPAPAEETEETVRLREENEELKAQNAEIIEQNREILAMLRAQLAQPAAAGAVPENIAENSDARADGKPAETVKKNG